MPEATSAAEDLDVTILLPAYNEEEAVVTVLQEIRSVMSAWQGSWEILVVDDASGDHTAARAEAEGVRVFRRIVNGGSGASRKSGVQLARGAVVAMMDADGSYDPAFLPTLLSYIPAYDQVNGARTSEEGACKLLRIPTKFLIRKFAEIVSGKRIPDLNTGLKVFKRDLMLRYLWVLPAGFSCVTSMTLAFLCNDHPVKYVPVTYRKRIGKSKFRPLKDTSNYITTIVRVVVWFRPLRLFAPLGLALLGLALARASWNAFTSDSGLRSSDLLLSVLAVNTLFFGVLADLIVKQRL